MHAPPAGTGSRPHPEQILLEAAAHLIEKRAAALRMGAAALDPIEELELAIRGIRQLAAELGRIQDARRIAEQAGSAPAAPSAGTVQGTPPVLVRGSVRRAA